MSIAFVNEIPAQTRATGGGKWGRVAVELHNNPGKIALVEEIPFSSMEERKKATQRAGGVQSRLRAYDTKATVRTAADEGVVRIYAQSI